MSEPLPLAAGWEPAGRLVLTALAIMGSPGPATISLVASGSAYGVRRSLGYLAGIVVGTAAVLLAVASGLTAALLALPALHRVLVAVAVLYIVWLAYHVATAPPLAEGTVAAAPSFAGGALLGVANPKAWVAIAAVFASVRLAPAAADDAGQKLAVLGVLVVAINAIWLVAGASLAPLVRDPRRSRIVNVSLAGALVAATALAVVR